MPVHAAALLRRLEAAGILVEDPRSAADRLAREHSSAPTPIEASDVERWASRSRSALRHLSRGEYDEARRELLEAQAIAERAAEALNRETLRARQVLDTCLFGVRASIETGDEENARAQARECRRLVPRMQPTGYAHTPEVRAVVAEVDASLAAEVTGHLVVVSRPAGCSVRVNGVYFGSSPLVTDELPRGSYRVQVECDDAHAGRVHRIELGEAATRVEVDVAFERVLRAEGSVRLVYGTDDARDTRLVGDARTLARQLGTPLLVAQRDDGRWLLRTFAAGSGGERVLALVDDDERGDADLLGSLGDVDEDRNRRPHGSERGTRALAGASVGLSMLSIGLTFGSVALGRTLEDATRTEQGYLDRATRHARLSAATLGFDVGVAALGSAAGFRWVRSSARPRLVAGLSGAVGVGLASAAAAYAWRAPRCYGGGVCARTDAAIGRSALLAGFALPALAIPLALRPTTEVPAIVSASLGPGHASFTFTSSLPR